MARSSSDSDTKLRATDIVVLTVIPSELEAVLRALSIDVGRSQKLKSGTVYWRGSVKSERAKCAYHCVVGCVGRPGNGDAAEIAGEFIRDFRPRFVMLAGIAAGIRGRTKIGHVVVSTTVYAYELGAVVRRGGKPLFTPRPNVSSLPHGINQDLAPYLVRARGMTFPAFAAPTPPEGKRSEYAAHVADNVTVIEGAVASGEKLLRDPEFLKELRLHGHGRIEAGDMEAAGLVQACTRFQVPWLVVRGISDFGDEFKDDHFQPFAATTSALVATDFLRQGLELLPTPATQGSRRKAPRVSGDRIIGLQSVRHNLPRPDYETFVGRRADLDDIVRRLAPYPKSQYSLICIDGTGGVGKSALALRTAYHFVENARTIPKDERFEQIIWTSAKVAYLTSSGIRYRPRASRTMEDILRSICVFFDREDLMSKDDQYRLEVIYQNLAKRRSLLIVDNLETILDEQVEAFVREVIAPTKVLMTSRNRIDMAYPVRLQGLGLNDTKALILQHGQARSLDITESEISQLHRATGGVPLAIYWSLGLRYLGKPFCEILEVLKVPESDLTRFCFEEILKRITDTPAYSAFIALACFPVDANIKGIAATADLTEAQCEGAVGQLEVLSLVNRKLDGKERGGRRFLLPTLAKVFAHGMLDKNALTRSFYFKRLISYLKSVGIRTQGAYYWRYGTYELYDDGENLRHMLPAIYAYGTAEDVFGLTNAVCDYLDYIGDWSSLIDACNEAIGYAESLSDSDAIANFSSTLGWYFIHQHRLDEAMQNLRRALDCYTTKPNSEGRCVVLHRISACHRKLNNYQAASLCCAEALEIASELKSGDLRALVMLELGKLERDRKQWFAAKQFFSEVGAWYEARAAQSPSDEVLSRSIWGHLASLVVGRLDAGMAVEVAELHEARTLCLKSLEFFFTHGSKSYFATLQFRLAKLNLALADPGRAAEYATTALQWFQQLGMSEDIEFIRQFLAVLPRNAAVLLNDV